MSVNEWKCAAVSYCVVTVCRIVGPARCKKLSLDVTGVLLVFLLMQESHGFVLAATYLLSGTPQHPRPQQANQGSSSGRAAAGHRRHDHHRKRLHVETVDEPGAGVNTQHSFFAVQTGRDQHGVLQPPADVVPPRTAAAIISPGEAAATSQPGQKYTMGLINTCPVKDMLKEMSSEEAAERDAAADTRAGAQQEGADAAAVAGSTKNAPRRLHS